MSETPIKIRMAPARALITLFTIGLLGTYFSAVALGYLQTPPGLPPFLFGLLALCLMFIAISYPFLILPPFIAGYELKISQEGIVVRSYGKEIIPWSAISSISMTDVSQPYRWTPVKRIELLFDGTLPPKLHRQVKTTRWRNFRKGVLATIIPELLTGMSAYTLYSVLSYHHKKYGGPNV
ncbi:hypothetical protein [Phyllobacterium sp. 22552]|uniref:hypothetical protein n=1 Tax=Phyllobacterium sp. 22552 TaxID=3453941 RepID=UPI003F848721